MYLSEIERTIKVFDQHLNIDFDVNEPVYYFDRIQLKPALIHHTQLWTFYSKYVFCTLDGAKETKIKF